MDTLNGIVTQVIQVSPIMKVFRIAPDGWELPDFSPGQFVAIGLPSSCGRCAEAQPEMDTYAEDKLIKRAYSIASSSQTKEYLEFYITLVHSGALTPRLFNLEIGDRVFVGQKFVGMFTLNQVPEDKNVVLIATGTGVAPYLSMLRTDALRRKGNISVIHGAANSWDLGYSSELQLLQSLSDKFFYLPTITEPGKEKTQWNGSTKFIQDMIADGDIEKFTGSKIDPDTTHIFLCGNPKMIATVTENLEKKGLSEWNRKNPEGQIHVEKF
ncbi:MAG: ferredoxin--NADP reductase [Bacteroidales bacterium]